MRTGAVILAAGKASRFGAPKQLLEFRGETLVDRACRTALEAGCDPVVRVLGAHAEAIQALPCPGGVATLVHDGWEEGMGSSLSAGVRRLLELQPSLDALFILLADQPLATSGLLETLRDSLGSMSIVWCENGASKGPPAIFAGKHFAELASLQGDRGAKTVIARHEAVSIDFPDAAWDIDSPEAWKAFLAKTNG